MRTTRAFLVSTVVVLALTACSPDAAPQPSSGSVEGSPQPSASTSIGASEGAAASVPPLAWERVLTLGAESPANGSEAAREVVHGTAGFLAMTESYLFGEGGPQLTQRRLWLSADGRAWEEVGFPVAIDEGSPMAMTATADGDFVLLFSIFLTNGLASRTEAMRSADGRSWEPFDTGLPDNLGIQAVDHGAQGWVLVGSRFGGEVEDPGAWYSSDGVTWELVAELSEPNRWVRVMDAAAGDEGFVIVGTSASLEGLPGHEWFALASADGREWVPSRGLFEPSGENFQPDPHVVALGSGWVAVLPSQDESVQFWASDDGLAWARSGLIADARPPEAYEYDPVLQEVGGRLYFSFAGGGGFASTFGAWSSADGVSWEPLDLGADVRLGGVAVGSGTLVLTGTERTPQGSLAGIWARGSD